MDKPKGCVCLHEAEKGQGVQLGERLDLAIFEFLGQRPSPDHKQNDGQAETQRARKDAIRICAQLRENENVKGENGDGIHNGFWSDGFAESDLTLHRARRNEVRLGRGLP